jgi:hypothetical protein
VKIGYDCTVVFKDRFGKQRSFQKSFKNQSHFENWVDYIERLNYKYQGSYEKHDKQEIRS